MRAFFPVLFFCFIAETSCAQVNVVNRSLTDSSLDYLYIGVDNTIEINWGNVDPISAAVTISGGGGSIMKIDKNRYIVRVSSVTDYCRIWVYQKGYKKLFNRNYKCRHLSDPVITLGNLLDTTATVEYILANPFLSAPTPGCFYKAKYRVVSFSAVFAHAEDLPDTRSSNNYLSEEQLNLIKKLRPGDRIFFDDIRVIGPEDWIRKMISFSLHIKE